MIQNRLPIKYCAWCFALCAIFCGCRDKNTFRLRGEFEHLRQSEFYIYSTDGGLNRTDTLHILEGQFDWQIPLSREATFYVVFPNLSEQVVFAEPGDVIDMHGDAEELRATFVEGSEDNELLSRFRVEHLDDNPAQLQDAMEEFISLNPESRVSTHLRRQISLQNAALSKLRVGQTLPPIVLPPDGLHEPDDTFRLDSGRPTLLIFWANWKRDSQDAFYVIRRIIRRSEHTQKKGRLQPVSISLDTDPQKYFFTCRYDSVTWPSRCYRLSWDTPIVKQLGICDLPYYILTDSLLHIVALGNKWDDDIAPHIDSYVKSK